MPNVLKKNSGRQTSLHAYLPFAYTDFNCVTTVKDVQKAIELPKGAVVTGGGIVIDTAFNSATSDSITVGDETVDNRYKTAMSAQATGFTALVPTGYETTAPTNVVLTLTPTGATMPTTGAGRLWVSYIIKNRAQIDQGA